LPLSFTLGGGRVIAGFDEGVTGMQLGGRRQLIIPPALAYGGQNNNVMVFTVEVKSVQ
jgi:peptidylprolyl isomerase